MIRTAPKPREEMLAVIADYRKIAVAGCNGCAKVCKTGGEEQVAGMVDVLRKRGKDVMVEVTPECTCYINHTLSAFAGKEDALRQCDAVLVLGCGGAAQVTKTGDRRDGIHHPSENGP